MVAIFCVVGGYRYYCFIFGFRRVGELYLVLFCRFYWRDRWIDFRIRVGCRGGDGGYIYYRYIFFLVVV